MSHYKPHPARPGLVVYDPPGEDIPGEKPPRAWSPELGQSIIDMLSKGLTPDKVASYHGITPSTFWDWIQKGMRGNRWLAEWSQNARSAMAEGILRLQAVVIEAATEGKNPDIALKLLDRLDKDFRRETKVIIESELERLLDALKDRLPLSSYEIVLQVCAEQAGAGALGSGEEGTGD